MGPVVSRRIRPRREDVSGFGRMIEETCMRIDQLDELNETELRARYARRNKIRYVDELLNEFEMLNLADETEISLELKVRSANFLAAEHHCVMNRPLHEVDISDWMEALYDIQDTLMIPFDDDID